MNSIDFGVFYSGKIPIKSIGDTLGLTYIVDRLYKTKGLRSKILTTIPEIFLNNPFVDILPIGSDVKNHLTPCLEYSCNIIEHYSTQFNLEIIKNSKPILYVSQDEINYAKNELKEFSSIKKIAVCLNSSAKSRDLEYSYIYPLLEKLKNDNYVLLLFGIKEQNDEIFDKSYIGKTNLRECISLMNECDLYLGVDTGLFHIMSALNKPQVVFFRNNGCSNNVYDNTHFLDSEIACDLKCKELGLVECKSEHECMKMFNIDEYYKIITNLLR
jgi:ADP-heptose:LPS heptosyltransferase